MKKILLSILILSNIAILYSQQTIINVKLSDKRIDTLTLSFYQEKLGDLKDGVIKIKSISTNGIYSFVIPAKEKLSYFDLESSAYPQILLRDYLVEKGDSVSIEVNTNTKNRIIKYEKLQFSGENSLKYQAKYKIDSIGFYFSKEHSIYTIDAGPQTNDYSVLYTRNWLELEKIKSIKLSELTKYEAVLPTIVYQTLKADIIYDGLVNTISNFNGAILIAQSYPDSTERLQNLKQFFLTRFENEIEGTYFNPLDIQSSKYYLLYHIRKILLQKRVINDMRPLKNATDLYEFIEHSPVVMRDKIITTLFSYFSKYMNNVDNKEAYLDIALKRVKDEYLYNLLLSYKTQLKGAEAFMFKLPDQNNKYYNLGDFKGKTVLIDFWFTGCKACVVIAKNLKKLKEKMIEEKDLIFISISVDAKKDIWLKSLKSEIYSDPTNINLFTEGKGTQHPLIQHYNFIGYPSLIIIDKNGKLFTNNAIRPGNEALTNGLIDVLKRALEIN